MMDNGNRRELKTRQKQWVKILTEKLVATKVTPNQISIVSVIFALLSGLSFCAFSNHQNAMWLIIAAIFIQLRLLANMMDGLVAVEGGKGTKSGELFNDIPDRFADVFILVGAGYAVTCVDWGVTLGWVAAMLAVMTAYIRTLGGSLGAPISFMGPMAKQHRMGLLTATVLLTFFQVLLFDSHSLLFLGLMIIVVGSFYTGYRRSAAIYRFLENNVSEDKSDASNDSNNDADAKSESQ